MRTLPPLNALRAFEAAGRHESFSRAAEELGVSHSAISKHVRGLEHRLGVQLFRDASRGVVLTREGASYLASVTPAFDRIAEATEVFGSGTEGTITINAETAFAVKWLMPNLKRFYDLYPEIDLQIEASRHLADIERYEADMVIRFVLCGAPDRPADLISDSWVYPYATPELAEKIDDNPENLLSYRLLRDRSGDPWTDWFQKIGRPELANELPRGKRMRAVLAHQAAVSGHGVFLGSAENVAADVAEGKLVRVFESGFWNGSYYLMLGDMAARRKPVRAFRDWLLNETVAFRTGHET